MLGVVIGFHSPAGYALPRQHLQSTIEFFRRPGVRVAVAQAVHDGRRPEPIPAGVASGVWFTSHTMFYKENLWNLGGTLIDCDRLLFVDGDVYYPRETWLEDTLRCLGECDVCQPHDVAEWHSRDGGIELRRASTAVALIEGIDPRPDTYHPGFAWAIHRSALERIGWWYDQHPAGGGDTAMAYAMTSAEHGEAWCRRLPSESSYYRRASYQRWRQGVQAAGLRVGVVRGAAIRHRWHGERVRRLYVGRSAFMPDVGPLEYPLVRRADGLLEWADDRPNRQAAEYFRQRLEDG